MSYGCGCKPGKFGKYTPIDYCPMHEAAPDLLEALQYATSAIESEFPGKFEQGRQAIEKATGKPYKKSLE